LLRAAGGAATAAGGANGALAASVTPQKSLNSRSPALRCGDGIAPRVELGQLRPRGRGAGEELLVALTAEAALGVGNPVELGLEVLQPTRLSAEAGEERAQLRAGLAQAQLDVAQLVAD